MTDLFTRATSVRLVVLDVDGVLTDGSIWTGENGELVKRFHTRDGLGIKMLQAAGIPVAILTGRISAQTAARAKELGITCVKQGKRFKTNAWEEILAEHGVSAEQTAYMGDDVPDIPKRGGNGAVRSLAEFILRSQGKWDNLIQKNYVEGDLS